MKGTKYAIVESLGELEPAEFQSFMLHRQTSVKLVHDGTTVLEVSNPTSAQISRPMGSRPSPGKKRFRFGLDVVVDGSRPDPEEVRRRIGAVEAGGDDDDGDEGGEDDAEAIEDDGDDSADGDGSPRDSRGADGDGETNEQGYETDGKMTFSLGDGPSS